MPAISNLPEKRTDICTGDSFNNAAGVKLCMTSVQNQVQQVQDQDDELETPYFPLSGESKYTVTFAKHDPLLTKYVVSVDWATQCVS